MGVVTRNFRAYKTMKKFLNIWKKFGSGSLAWFVEFTVGVATFASKHAQTSIDNLINRLQADIGLTVLSSIFW